MHSIPTRRQFVKKAVGALAVGSGLVGAAAAAATPIPIVDTHQHLWDLDRFRLSWIERASPFNRSFRPRDYAEATRGLNVVKAVYMEVDVDPEQQVAEAEFVLDLCGQANTPTVAAVISGRPAAEGFRAYLTRFRGNRHLKGVRQVLHRPETPAGFCTGDNFVRGLRVLDELGLSFDLCLRAADLGDAVRIAELLPNLRFILDHCGNANVQARDRTQWQRDMARVARCRNVVGKVSGIVASARRGQWTADDLAPIVNHTLDVFGPDRVMFGGDWPVCTLTATYRQWVDALKSIVSNRSAQDQRKLFHDNAVRFYGLA